MDANEDVAKVIASFYRDHLGIVFARDVTKKQAKKLSILQSLYFHEVLQYLNIFT